MTRVMNFAAGPAALPQSVLEAARDELLDFQGTGKSILETSHRSPEYDAVHEGAQQLVKKLLGVGDDYHVLFMGGGASAQFVLVPLNLLGDGERGEYVVTGSWAKKAYKEAVTVAKTSGGSAHVAATTEQDGRFTRIPEPQSWDVAEDAAYVHITSNNTISGTQFALYKGIPECAAPLVADMSSDILSYEFDAKKLSLIYAGAQKNLGPAGVTLVVIRQDMLDRARADLPTAFNYQLQAKGKSLANTPPCYAIYMLGKVLGWIEEQGGVGAVQKVNEAKGALIYGALDELSDFYRAPVAKDSRSLMNVVFRLPSEALEKRFIADATERGMIGIKGHRSVGGIRVSTYNAVPLAWVEAVVSFMREFAKANG
ncbi:MAG: 3-phosphoserine/phosphohydroxythreonine transaminase [Myxococcales bacterium]|nr:3-phosphoserine/phosphohydroxythreonine transaminase [Myxococcales bacterium]